MWLTTVFGFYSIVETPEDSGNGSVTIRTRIRTDLEALREYVPQLGGIVENPKAEYPFHVKVPRKALEHAMPRIVATIKYPSFRGAVLARQGRERADIIERVFKLLERLRHCE